MNPIDQSPLYGEISGISFYDSLVHAYMLGLGDWSTDDFGNRPAQEQFIWLQFFAATFILNLTFMNMLIAIMGDIFGQVNEKQSQSKMEERLNLL